SSPIAGSTAPVSQPAPTSSTAPRTDDDGVRPMALAPTTTRNATAVPPQSTMAAGTGASPNGSSGIGGSGSGGAPNISYSAFPLHDDGVVGSVHNYHVNTPDGNVPVGAAASFRVVTPDAHVIDTTSILWSGGTIYQGYFQLPANSAAPI